MRSRFPSVSVDDAPVRVAAARLRRPSVRLRTFRSSLAYAVEGIREAWRTQPNLRLHIGVGGLVILLGIWCRLSMLQWLWVIFAIGLVVFAEMMNTAIEQTVDLVVGLRPDPLARRVKDIAAGCVLVAAILSVAIGLFVFLPSALAR